MFRNKLKSFLVDEKYRVIPAFSLHGVDYWMYDSAVELPAGRFFAAMGVYQEMESGCDKDYLKMHTDAMDKVLGNPKQINLQVIMQLNIHLKERAGLVSSDMIYKLASVVFFDKTESLYSYDYEYNEKKIEKWKAAGGALDFFSRTPLKELVPLLNMPERDTQTYLAVTEAVLKTHRKLVTGILSESV